jgi:ribosomal protein S18 acetylase RimI-like enzyme
VWQAPIAAWREMLPWVRGWGSAAEVLAPAGLRDELIRDAQRLAEVYGLADDREKRNAIEIYSIYVQPEFIRKNIGAELLRAIENEAKNLHKESVFLWVLKKNEKGIRFYRKHDYDEDGMIKLILEWKEMQIRMTKNIEKRS